MSVTVITPGRVVRVDPDTVDADDVLEFGAAMIEEQGHVKNAGGDAAQGWSIHGAIGEAARRATGENAKDGPRSRALRDEAARRISDRHDRGEMDLNDDPATDQAAAAKAMLDARGAA